MPRVSPFPGDWIVWFVSLAAFPVSALEREPNTTLTLPQDPPVFGYTTESAFGSLEFLDPLVITSPHGETNRLFVAEQDGIVAVIPDLAAPTRAVFLDISARVSGGRPSDERGLLGFTFHPGYATNGHFYLYYSTTTNGSLHQRLSRFSVTANDPNVADPASEFILFSQRDEANNHNGGDLHFGPDGYLYISLGDEGGGNDSYNNSQFIDRDFHAGVFRIDVDLRPDSLPPNPHPSLFPGAYAIPPDNPWIGATEFNGRTVDPAEVRTEFWAVGLRNPWRMSFDALTGRLWLGDVGQGSREEINIIVRGGNYGWAYREGTINGPKASQAPPGFTDIPPLVEYRHGRGPTQGDSVTGGVVYRGLRLSQLTGAYVYADYLSGNIWAIRWDGSTNSPPVERLTGLNAIAGFGIDPRNGDVLLADQGRDIIARLTYNDQPSGTPLPPTLADTGAFTDLLSLSPAQGIVPYEINVPFWSDGADKQRWFSVPNTNQFIQFHLTDPWSFPTGSVWVKHFSIDTTNNVPESRRRLETRFLVRNPEGVYGLTYRWTDPPTNAVLVPEDGLDEALLIHDPVNGLVRTQVWHYPGRGECLQCHTPAAGWILGFKTAQLNRLIDTATGPVHQIAELNEAGYFTEPLTYGRGWPILAHATNQRFSVEWRVRSWLDANCSQCHLPGGTAPGAWDARASTPLTATGLILGELNTNEGDPENRLIVPGSLENSMVHSRITRLGPGRMPPLASRVIDQTAAALLAWWITNDLAGWQSFASWQTTHFASTEIPEAAADADPDKDGVPNWIEYLTSTDPTLSSEAWKATIQRETEGIQLRYQHLANRRVVLEATNDLLAPESWQPLDVEQNEFVIPAEPFPVELGCPVSETAKFYRIRVIAP
jgi:glucose/arabinose dehydrogenase